MSSASPRVSGSSESQGESAAESSVDAADGPWLMLVYRVPSDSSKARVAVWRELKRIDELGGSSLLLTLRDIEDEARVQFVDGFLGQSAKEYAEIVEECETKFFKEIEFERFRGNYTFEEAEEIRQDLEKLRRWLAKVIARDWMGAYGREPAERKGRGVRTAARGVRVRCVRADREQPGMSADDEVRTSAGRRWRG